MATERPPHFVADAVPKLPRPKEGVVLGESLRYPVGFRRGRQLVPRGEGAGIGALVMADDLLGVVLDLASHGLEIRLILPGVRHSGEPGGEVGKGVHSGSLHDRDCQSKTPPDSSPSATE